MIVIVPEVSTVTAGLLANIGTLVAVPTATGTLPGGSTVVTIARRTTQPKNVGTRNMLNILAAIEAVLILLIQGTTDTGSPKANS